MQAATDEGRTANLVYFVFDLLFLDGEKLAGLPLLERKERLKALVEGAPRSIQYSDHHIGDGQRFLQVACGAKAEGIISKRVNAPYAWVLPELVCEVRFLTWTADGLVRQGAYEGLRADKPAKDVRRHRPA
jgi:ATP-dependent DNA ligase